MVEVERLGAGACWIKKGPDVEWGSRRGGPGVELGPFGQSDSIDPR
jgi:hypothetical protein